MNKSPGLERRYFQGVGTFPRFPNKREFLSLLSEGEVKEYDTKRKRELQIVEFKTESTSRWKIVGNNSGFVHSYLH